MPGARLGMESGERLVRIGIEGGSRGIGRRSANGDGRRGDGGGGKRRRLLHRLKREMG
jgi:hypothetical protein